MRRILARPRDKRLDKYARRPSFGKGSANALVKYERIRQRGERSGTMCARAPQLVTFLGMPHDKYRLWRNVVLRILRHIHAESKTSLFQDVNELLQRFAPEVAELHDFALSTPNQIADSLDIRSLKTILRPYGKIQLFNGLEQDLPGALPLGIGYKDTHRRNGNHIHVQKQLDVFAQNAGCTCKRQIRHDRPVCGHLQFKPLVIDFLTYARRLHGVTDTLDRRIDSIYGDDTYRIVFALVLVCRYVSASLFNAKLYAEAGILTQRGDVMTWIEDLEVCGGSTNIAGCPCTWSLQSKVDSAVGTILRSKTNSFEIENDVGNVFRHSRYGRKLVLHSVNPKRRYNHAT